MKKITLSLAILAGAFGLTGCGSSSSSVLGSVGSSLVSGVLGGSNSSSSSTTTTSSSSSSSSLLGNLLSGILGSSSKLSQSDIVGTWSYTGSDCVFESENLLMKAGGEVAASKIESQMNSTLEKIGIKQGACSFTFNSDNTYSATIGGRSVSGNYTLDTTNKKITMTYLGGIGKMTPHITKSGKKISLLIESDKLLKLAKGISSLSSNSTMKAASSLLSSYDGMLVGLQLQK
jgi:hypothetical protein